jgi:hypothetical protein
VACGQRKKEHRKPEIKGNRKENLNRIRGTQKVIDPERGLRKQVKIALLGKGRNDE